MTVLQLLSRVIYLFSQRRAVRLFEQSIVRTNQCRVHLSRENARRGVETIHIQIAISKATVGLVELGDGGGLVCLELSYDALFHGLGFRLGSELRLLRKRAVQSPTAAIVAAAFLNT